MASKLIIPTRSAHASSSKRSVHISELVRRCMNTTRRLEWHEYFVPSLNDYMKRMMQAGYHEYYRKDILLQAIYIYERKVEESESGGEPLNRPNNYKRLERIKAKQKN